MTGARSILGYKGGRVVPYRESDASVRERCAASALPVPSLPDAPQGVATWETVRVCLRELLSRAGGEIKLPNVKRLFRSEFGVQLSETALGHQRVQDLLQDPRLCDVCVLHRRESVHMVLAVEPPAGPLILSTTPPAGAAAAPLAPQLHDADRGDAPPREAFVFGEFGPPGGAEPMLQPAALHASEAAFAALPAPSCQGLVGAMLPAMPCQGGLEVQAQEEWKRWAHGGEEEKKMDSPWDYGGSGDSSSSSTADRSRVPSDDGEATCPICLVPMSEAEERFMESPWVLLPASPPASLRASSSGNIPYVAAGLSGALGGRPGRFAALLEADGTTETSNASLHVPDMESASRSAARRPCSSLPPSLRLAPSAAERRPAEP
ncbi:unnamed protein product [Prorocentrum cordatum]|uniref:HTH OST-type domain-containing protein n=1 Tax=Prorocentrum cordatum TaxID=2364126 RepID=A0ABN9WFI3_9DINO|nr:unnamed protein product [Polarella glacialis]